MALQEMLNRNKKFAQTHQGQSEDMAQMAAGMTEGVVVLLCSDPRIHPEHLLGLDSSLRATIVRNAGGRVSEAMRTILVLQTLSHPGTIVVMHHTDCGLIHYNDSDITKALLAVAPDQEEKIKQYDWGEMPNGPEESVLADLATLRASPLIKPGTKFVGLVYDLETGLLKEVEST